MAFLIYFCVKLSVYLSICLSVCLSFCLCIFIARLTAINIIVICRLFCCYKHLITRYI